MKQDILVLVFGGTIDSHYDYRKTPPEVPLNEGTAIASALKGSDADGNPLPTTIAGAERCNVERIVLKDSKSVTRSDLARAVALMRPGYKPKKVIITHGTDTMPPHGRDLEDMMAAAGIDDKVVVFTGAMRPLRNEHAQFVTREETDGYDNLEKAIADVDTLSPGVYIRMGAELHHAQDVAKKVVYTDGHVDWESSGFEKRSSQTTRSGHFQTNKILRSRQKSAEEPDCPR